MNSTIKRKAKMKISGHVLTS